MMASHSIRLGRILRSAAAGFALAATSIPALADPAKVEAVEGRPVLMLGAYDLASVGYQQREFFVSGEATSYRLDGPAGSDGMWKAMADAKAPFTTRVVVLRPVDATKFNGTVLVEWLNVTAGQDTPADWMVAHREMIRKGYAYVAVSAQKVGVDGGAAIMQQGRPLKTLDPKRYAALSHPGDAFSYDIFSQAGALAKTADIFGGLKPARVIGIGESQSAAFLVTYVNAVDPVARIYDGFFVHSRFGSGAAIDGSRMSNADPKQTNAVPAHVRFRRDLRVPVLSLITETDLLGARLSGYHASRTPDTARLRVWELAGSAHADNYLFGGSFIDSGSKTSAELARIFVPTRHTAGGDVDLPVNPGMPHHYVAQGAIAALDTWVRSGRAPARAPALTLATGGSEGVVATLAKDANGLALGGLRTPWTDVPTIRLSGEKNSDNFLGLLVGKGEPFDKATLARLYPGGKAAYLRKFTASLDAAIRKGFIVAADRQEILDIAGINFDLATQ